MKNVPLQKCTKNHPVIATVLVRRYMLQRLHINLSMKVAGITHSVAREVPTPQVPGPQ